MSTGLTVQGLNVARSGKAILHDVDLTISAGEDHRSARRQWRGKEQPRACDRGRVAGLQRRDRAGHGHSIVGQRPDSVRAKGVAAVPEGHQVLNDLSVEDNLKVAGCHLTRAQLQPALAQCARHVSGAA